MSEDPVGLPEAIDAIAHRVVAMDESPREARLTFVYIDGDDWRQITKRADEIRTSVDCADVLFNSAVRFLKARSGVKS